MDACRSSRWIRVDEKVIYDQPPDALDPAGESRRVSIGLQAEDKDILNPEDLVVAEVTEGPLTWMVMEGQRHDHAVAVDRWTLGRFFKDQYGAEGKVEVIARTELAKFFSDGTAYLADLMDLLDAARIPYGYMAWVNGGPVVWRPARDVTF